MGSEEITGEGGKWKPDAIPKLGERRREEFFQRTRFESVPGRAR